MSGSSHSQEDTFSAPPAAEKPRFFFDTYDGQTLVEDEEGLELEGPQAARDQAQAALADMVRDVMPDGDQRTLTIRVRNESGKTVLKATVSLMVEWEP
jgi:hypothetical protein